MKRKFAVLTVLGALVALAVPAISSAAMFPAGHKFEIAGNASGPKLTTSLGSCPITKITMTIPTAPGNETSGPWAGATVTAGTCTAGTSITLASEWKFSPFTTNPFLSLLLPGTPTEGVVMRFSSLPGCKLVGSPALTGIWSNGTTAPTLLKSAYHAHSASNLAWANDGGSCALAGKTESLTYQTEANGWVNTVTDLTSPSTPITVANNK